MAFDFRLPDYFRTTDFSVFEALYKIMFGALKKDVDGITELKCVNHCAEHMLPLLAHNIGCDYFSETTPEVNRLILKNWWWLMKNKGTIGALQTAASLGLIAYDAAKGNLADESIMYGRTVEIITDKVTGEVIIRVAYQSLEEETEEEEKAQQEWMKRIVEYVRPAGFKVSFVPSQFTKAFINMLLSNDVNVNQMIYDVEINSALPAGIYWEYKNISQDINCFGQYSIKDPKCTSCVYKTQCEEYTIMGMGQEESSGLDGVERYQGPNTENETE